MLNYNKIRTVLVWIPLHPPGISANGEEHPKSATRYNNLGSAYRHKGEYDKAINYYEKALDIDIKFLPANHPHIAIVHKNLAFANEAVKKIGK